MLSLAALALGVAHIAAQGGVTNADIDRRMREITNRLNCPLCQGQTLHECPLQVCDEMRDLIRQKLLAGESEDQIRAYFVERFGDRVLNEPPRQGFALLGWVMPVLAVLTGAGLAAWAIRAMTRRQARPVVASANGATQAANPPVPPDLPREYVERLERDLRQME
jgi:cytochrome c-type biogenesis protein CcmH